MVHCWRTRAVTVYYVGGGGETSLSIQATNVQRDSIVGFIETVTILNN